jgi:membrane protease YdiL (CAAX protease family)
MNSQGNATRHMKPIIDRNSLVDYIKKIIVLGGIIALYWSMQQVATQQILTRFINLPVEFSVSLTAMFEHHVWQFVIGMVAIAVLSRGNLWCYGINSMNVNTSLGILLRFYCLASIFIFAAVVVPLLQGNYLPLSIRHSNSQTMLLWILFQWMATPVADEIFFHGVIQTVMLKYWPEELAIGSLKIPVAIVFSTIAFTFGRVNVPMYGSETMEYLLAMVIGFFGGWVYYKTRSLLTPMLAQAFFYGMPFAIRFAFHLW